MPADDFDFLVSFDRIRHRRLADRLVGSTEWRSYATDYRFEKILGGLGNTDVLTGTIDGRPFEGHSLRVFDPGTDQWHIHWVDTLGLRLEPPVVGRFVDGRGAFFGKDQHDGRTLDVRYIWSRIGPTGAHWEQAWSVDGGREWETNAHMDFLPRSA